MTESPEWVRQTIESAVRYALAQLDGSTESAVKLLTGMSDERLQELGGFRPPDDAA